MRYMRLGDVCKDIVDCPHESPEWKSEGIAVIRNFNLVNGQINMQDGYYVDEETYKKRTRRAVPAEGDIIFSREAPIGNCAIVPRNFKCCLGQRLVLLRVNHTVCSSEYLLAVLQSSYVKQQIEQVSKRGSIVSNFAIGDLYDLIIPVLDNQKDVALLSSLFAEKLLINNSICTTLESMAKLLYDYWFVQFDFPDENGKPYKSSGGKMVWNEELKREIPEGWEVKNLSDVAELQQNAIFPSEGVEYNHYSIPAFDESKMPSLEDGETIASNKYVVPDGSILVSKLNPQFKRIWLVLDSPNNAICSTEFLPVKVTDVGIYYLYSLLNTEAFSVHLKQKASSSTGSRKRIDPENVMSFQFAYNKRVARLFNEKTASLIHQTNQIPEENQQLASLRDFLLPMLMNGQVKVEAKGKEHESA